MSDINPSRMIPLYVCDQAVAACDAEIAKLREQVERLEAWKREAETQLKLAEHWVNQSNTIVERLTKAGDAFISVGVKMREMIGDHHWTLEFDRVRTDWYFAAKEGKDHA
jgi:ribosomal protein L9